MYSKSVKIVGKISRLRGHFICPRSLDNMGRICHLRQVLTNPGKYAYMGSMWSKMEDYGLKWRDVQLHI